MTAQAREVPATATAFEYAQQRLSRLRQFLARDAAESDSVLRRAVTEATPKRPEQKAARSSRPKARR